MTISERIFEKIRAKGMSQKEFSELTGIQQSTISEWKSKKTNPAADKIMPICKALQVSPEWLLSGTGNDARRRQSIDYYVISRDSELGMLISQYNDMDQLRRKRLQGYLDALRETD